MSLTDIEVRNAKPAEKTRKLSAGGGLQLWVKPNGSKLWCMAYRFGGKQRKLSIGVYPAVSLKAAKERAGEAREVLARDIDPSAYKQAQREARSLAAATTFAVVADELVALKEREGASARTLKSNRWLVEVAKAELGALPVDAVTAPAVLDALRLVEARGHLETARRLKSVISQVMRFAVTTKRAVGDPTADLRGAIAAPTVTSRAAILDPVAFGGLLRAVWAYEGPIVRAALQISALCFQRPGETRQARWDEIDLAGAVWSIPAGRMKMRRAHRVALPRQAVAILEDLKKLTGQGRGGFAFPSGRSVMRPLSDGGMNAALAQMGYAGDVHCVHGFRASASTMLNESGRFSGDVIEAALAHVEEKGARRAYKRTDHFRERVVMAQWWADEIDRMRDGAKVIPLRAAGDRS